MSFNNILYIAVGRTTDNVVLCETTCKNSHEEASFAASVRQVVRAPNAKAKKTKYSLTMKDATKMHFLTDDESRIFISITEKEYPERVAQKMLEEVKQKFMAKYGEESLKAAEGSIKGDKIIKNAAQKFDDFKQHDKLSGIKAEVEETTAIMADNVRVMLKNTEKTDKLADDVDELRNHAQAFGAQAKGLKNQMRCKQYKMQLIVALVVLVLIAIIIAFFVKPAQTTTVVATTTTAKP